MGRSPYIHDEVVVKKIIKYWEQGQTYSYIADHVGIARSTMGTVVRELINMGVIQGRKRKLEPSVLVPGTVNCTTEVSRRCKYGISFQQTNSGSLCNYLLKEGKPRGCSPKACTKFCEDQHKLPVPDREITVEGLEIYDKIEKIEKEVEREVN